MTTVSQMAHIHSTYSSLESEDLFLFISRYTIFHVSITLATITNIQPDNIKYLTL